TIFHLPQATYNNHNSFVAPLSFSNMVPFYKQQLGLTMELKTSSSFKTTGLLQPWQILCKIFSKCLTTRVTGWDQPSLQIMQMMYCFVNNIHVDYEELLWEGIYYSLHHPTSSILYPRFTKIIVRRHKDKVGMQIPAWMIVDEMKHTEHYRMYVEVLGIDVPLTQSQPTESTQGTHRTPSAPRSPNPNKEAAESSAPRRSTVIRLRIPERRSTRLTPPAPVPNVDKADEMILQDTLQVSLAEHKSREEQEARENVALVDEHLASEEIEKMVDGQENVVDDSSIPRNDESNIPGTRIEPRSNKESPEVEITKDKEVEITKETPVVDITNVVIPVNVNDEDEEITDEVYELKRREKGKIVEETRNSPIPTPIRSPRIHTNLVSSDTEKLQELTDTHTTSSSSSPHTKLSKTNRLLSLFKTKPTRFKRYKSFFQELQGRYGYLFAHLRARFMPRKSFDTLADNLHDVMVETLPTMVDKHIKEQVMKQVPEQVRNQVLVYVAEGLILERQKAKEETERLIAKAILQERGNIQAQISTQIENAIANVIPSQVDASVRNYMSGHILHVHPAQSQTSSVPEQQYSTVHCRKAILNCNNRHSYMVGFQIEVGKNTVYKLRGRSPAVRPRNQDRDIVWRVEKKFLSSLTPQKTTPLDLADKKDPEAPALSLINQDLLYLKKGNSGPEKIVLSLHKFPAIIFNDDDIKEQTSRWVNKSVKKFNPYARYGVEHWKNPHTKIFYIRKQKEPGKPKEEIYSNSKIVQVIKTYWELGHEHKFITEIVARRANDCIVSITEPDYKNLNMNDIEDIYLLIMNGKIPDYADTGLLCYQQKVNLTPPTITFPGIEKHDMFSIVYEPAHRIIYKNSKKEKRVMRHTEIHKFCDATLNRVLEGLKSYNNDVKYGYVQKDLTKDETEYLKLFEEEIEEQDRSIEGSCEEGDVREWKNHLGLRRERLE
ncbi:hypothetical protein Tco_0768037, partial [Tanacetum coccineum]